MASVARFDTWQAADGTNVARFSGGELQVWDGAAWVPGGTTVATGGDHVGTANGYKYHVFLSSGTFTLSSSAAAVPGLWTEQPLRVRPVDVPRAASCGTHQQSQASAA